MFTIKVEDTLEVRLFKMSLLLCMGAALMLLLQEIMTDKNPVDLFLEIFGFVFATVCFWLSNRIKRVDMLINVFIYSVILMLTASWYSHKGLGIGLSLDFLVMMNLGLIIVIKGQRRWFLAFFCVVMFTILLVEYFHKDFYYIATFNRQEPILAKSIFIVIAYTISAWLVIYLKNQYDKASVLSEEQNALLKKINIEMEAQAALVQRANDYLEEQVNVRTSALNKQKERLMKYAFFNSHKVRAPLSNMLGILLLLEQEEHGNENVQKLITMLMEESVKLDDQVRLVQDMIHESPTEDEVQKLWLETYKAPTKA